MRIGYVMRAGDGREFLQPLLDIERLKRWLVGP
jgi:hypothetical protein